MTTCFSKKEIDIIRQMMFVGLAELKRRVEVLS